MSNQKEYKIRIGRNLVPVDKKLYLFYYRTQRRWRYMEQDIKMEMGIKDSSDQLIGLKPSKEDSMNRLEDDGMEFSDEIERLQDVVERRIMAEKLHKCLPLLTEDELRLIKEIFFNQKTERQAAKILGISQQTLHDKKVRTLAKLHKLLKNQK